VCASTHHSPTCSIELMFFIMLPLSIALYNAYCATRATLRSAPAHTSHTRACVLEMLLLSSSAWKYGSLNSVAMRARVGIRN
jgi:hypothetical protein